MQLHAPQLIVLGFVVFGLSHELIKHGEPKTGSHSIIVAIIANAIHLSLLYWGGFFK
jgi:hypothetical protein